MLLTHWLSALRQNLAGPGARRTRLSRRQIRKGVRTRRLRDIERLEDRTLLASQFGFAQTFGDNGIDTATAVATDSVGNTYVTGQFVGTFDFDPGPGTTNLTAPGAVGGYISKFTPQGTLIWAALLGGAGGTSLAVDANDDVYIGWGPNASKFANDGTQVWTVATGATINAVALGAGGELYLGGFFSGTIDADPGSNTTTLITNGSTDAFLARYNTDGTFVQAFQFGGTGGDTLFGLATDTTGNVYATGSFSNQVDFDPGSGQFVRPSSGGRDAFVVSLDSTGGFRWARSFGSNSADEGLAIAVDSANNVITTGYFNGIVDFDPTSGTANLDSLQFGQGAYVSKLDSDGGFVWARGITRDRADIFGRGVTVDSFDNVITTGGFSSIFFNASTTVDFDPGAGVANLTSQRNEDAFIQRLSSAGNFLEVLQFRGLEDERGNAVAVDFADQIYVAGQFAGTVDFDPTAGVANLSSSGGNPDPFLTKIAVPSVIVMPTSGLVTTELATTASFTITLATQPTSPVTIGLSSSNLAEGIISVPFVTFTPANWNVPRTITVTGVDDAVIDGDQAFSIVTAAATSVDPDYNGLNPPDVSVTNLDNDGAGINLTLTSPAVTTEDGGTATFQVTLNNTPTGNVFVLVNSSDFSEGFPSPSFLFFQPSTFDIPQTITVFGQDDSIIDGNQNYDVSVEVFFSNDPAYAALSPVTQTFTNLDNDIAGVTVFPTSGLVTTEVGGSANFAVVLNTQPAADVTINVTSSNLLEGLTNVSTLTFTPSNFNQPQTVVVTGQDDSVPDGDQVYSVVLSNAVSVDANYNNLDVPDVSVTNIDNDFPVVTLPGPDPTFTEGDLPVVVDEQAQLTAPVTTDYTNGTLTASVTGNPSDNDRLSIRNQGTGAGQIGVNGNTVTFSGVTIGTLSGGIGAIPLVVTLTGSATTTAVQALIRNVTFEVVGDDPSTLPRTVQIVVRDGAGTNSPSSTKPVTVIAVNDAPFLNIPSGPVTFTDSQGQVILDGAAGFGDPDSHDLNGGTLTVSLTGNNPIGQVTTLASTDVPRLVSDFTTVTSTLPVTGLNGSLTDVNVNLTITHTFDADLRVTLISPAGTRVSLFSGVGGSGQNFIGTTLDDEASTAVVAGTAPFTGSFRPQGVLANVDGESPNGTWQLEVVDTAGGGNIGTLESWALVLSTASGGTTTADDRLTIRNEGNGPQQIGVFGNTVSYGAVNIGTFSGGVGTTSLVVNFNTNATPEAAQALMRNIQYESVGQNPSDTARTVQFISTDGDGGTSNTVTQTVDVVAVNDPPEVTLPSGTLNFTETGAPLVIDANATVEDADSPILEGGLLTVALTQNGQSTDRLDLRHQGTLTGQIGVSGTEVQYGGVVIGSYAAGTATTPLTVTLNSNANLESVQALVRNVTFQAEGLNPPLVDRTVEFTLSDGDGGTSAPVTKTIVLSRINRAPSIDLPGPALTYIVGTPPSFIDPQATLFDEDSTNFENGQLTISLGATSSANDKLEIFSQGVAAGQINFVAGNVQYGGINFGTASGGIGPVPLVVSFNGQATQAAIQALLRNLTFRVDATNATTTPRTVQVSVTDGDGGSSTPVSKTITVQAQNNPPVNTVPAGPYQTLEDTAVSLTDLQVDDSDLRGGTLAVTLKADHGTITVLGDVAGGVPTDRIANNGTAAVNLSGTIAEVNATLAASQGVVYLGETDFSGTDTFTIVTNDNGFTGPGGPGVDTDTVAVVVTEVVDPPRIVLPSASPTSVRGAPVIVDGLATFVAPDSDGVFDGGQLVVRNTGANASVRDRLRIRHQGRGDGQIGVSRNRVSYEGVLIGTFGGGRGGTPLIVNLSSSISQEALEALLRSVLFQSSPRQLSTLPRTIEFQLSDSSGTLGIPASKTVFVTL